MRMWRMRTKEEEEERRRRRRKREETMKKYKEGNQNKQVNDK